MTDMAYSTKLQTLFMLSQNFRIEFCTRFLTIFLCRIVFIFRHPKSVDAWNVFLSPFVDVVWLLIFGTAISTSILIRTFFSFENRLSAKSSILQTATNDDTYYNSFLIIFGILFQQGIISCTNLGYMTSILELKFHCRLLRQSIIHFISDFHINISPVFACDIPILWFVYCWFFAY